VVALPQELLLAAALLGVLALARAIGAVLRELEPEMFEQAPLLPIPRSLVALLAHYAGHWLRLSWRAEQSARLLAAGLAGRPTPPEWFAWRCLAAVAVFALALGMALALGASAWGLALSALLTPLMGAWIPELWLRQRSLQRGHEITAQLPLYLEFALAGLEAGLALRPALQVGMRTGPDGPVREALRGMLAETARDAEVGEVLRKLSQRLQHRGARGVLDEISRSAAAGAGLRSGLQAALTRESARRTAWLEWHMWRQPGHVLRPLLACQLPGLILTLLGAFAMR
jgi:hypothetical protein